jgi:cytochrome c-type biogenesis protein CcmH
MGWLVLVFLVGLSIACLWLFGVRFGLLKACAAALMVGAAGYAFQGSPDLPGAPARNTEARQVLPLTEARHAFFGQFTPSESWLRMSEALARDGEGEEAVGILQNAIGRYPGDPQLWIGLGNALVDHARGLTPAAEFAYQRAAEAAPGHPAAPFFYGLARARSGDRRGAVEIWKRLLGHAPKDAAWRPLVEQGVAALSKPSAAQPQAVTGS